MLQVLTQLAALAQAYVTIILMISTYFYLKRARSKYDMSCSSLPLEIAAVMDINVDNNKAGEGVKFGAISENVLDDDISKTQNFLLITATPNCK